MAGPIISEEELDALTAELRRKHPVARVEAPAPEAGKGPEPFNMETVRRLREAQIVSDQIDAYADARLAERELQRMAPHHPARPALEARVQQLKFQAQKSTQAIDAMREREKLRAGREVPWVQQEIERALSPRSGALEAAAATRRLHEESLKRPGGYAAEQAKVEEPGLAQKVLGWEPIRYPLKGITAALRPISAPAPAFVASLQGERPFGEELAARVPGTPGETGLRRTARAGLDVLGERIGRAITAGQAAADPLGRFTPAGARRPLGTQEPASWHDVVERWFQGQQKPVTREQLEAMVARGEAPTVQDAASKVWLEQSAKVPGTGLEVGRGATQAGAFLASIGLDPAVWLSAPRAAAGGGIRFAGLPVVPEAAATLGGKASLRGAGKALSWPFRKLGEWELKEGLPLRLGAKRMIWRYADVGEIADPYVRDQVMQAFRLRDAAVSQQGAEWALQVQRLLKGVPEEQRQLLRDIIESPPERFEWGPRAAESFRGPPPPALAVRRPVQGPGFEMPGMEAPPGARPGPLGPAATFSRVTPGRRPTGPRDVAGRADTGPLGPIPAPGAVPEGTAIPPGAPRMGAFPVEPVHEVTTAEARLAAGVEDMLRGARRQIHERGAFQGSPETALALYDPELAAAQAGRPMWGRERYFPRERTLESKRLERGEAARPESTGLVGPESGPKTSFGALRHRKEAERVNRLIAELNASRAARRGEPGAGGMPPERTLYGRGGKPVPPPEQPVADVTSELNRFYRRPPEELRREFGGPIKAEPERFLDDVEATLVRYGQRVTRGVNDYDLMTRLRTMTDAQGRVLAKPVVGVGKDGIPVEKVPFGVQAGNAAEPGLSTLTRPVPDYRVPSNKAWQQAFPNVALPREISRAVDQAGRPYWSEALHELLFVKPMHRLQSGWKTAATTARLGFGLRNYFSQFGMNVAAYGPAAADPRKIMVSHFLALPDGVFAQFPGLERLPIQIGQHTLTVGQVRALGRQAGLLRTLPREVIYGGPEMQGALEFTPHATRSWQGFVERHPSLPWGAAGAATGAAWGGAPGAAIGGALGAALGSRAGRPFNPLSREFLLTKHLFAPIAEFSEKQGRFLAFLLEMQERAGAAGELRAQADQAARVALIRRGQSPDVTGGARRAQNVAEQAERAAQEASASSRDLLGGALRASQQQVDYAAFAPWFEKYATLVWPFAKWNVGMLRNLPEWTARRPGLANISEQAFRSGEHMVPPWERAMVKREEESKLERDTAARVVGFPGLGPLREPANARAKGGLRLPYATASPFAALAWNIYGAPARILHARERGRQVASEALESALPAWKVPFELLTGRNLYTQEPIDLQRASRAPRGVQILYERDPELATRIFKAAPVYDAERRLSYLAVPTWVSLFVRYFPNITTYDLAGVYLGGKAPYDSKEAITLRLFGLTQLLHDPQLATSQQAKDAKAEANRVVQEIESWMPPPTPRKAAP